MAGVDVIGIAISIALLVIVTYVVVGSLITTTTVVYNAQNDMSSKSAESLDTAIQISAVMFDGPYNGFCMLHFHLTNTGNEIIRKFNAMDVYVVQPGSAPVYYRFNGTLMYPPDGLGVGDAANNRTWNYAEFVPSDPINQRPDILYPGDTMSVRIWNYACPAPANFQVGVITPNGVSDFYTD